MGPEQMKALRNMTGKTQEDFAREFGVVCDTYGRWERGQRTPSRLARKRFQQLWSRYVK